MGGPEGVSADIGHEEDAGVAETLKGGFFLLSLLQLRPSHSAVLNCLRACGSSYKLWKLPG